jgi:predicted regulator of Ras-like GTPase activity (Roadblock/LC7/MglB family)
MSPVQPPPESASRSGRLDRILRDLLHQTPGVEAAAVVSFDGLPMASALPAGMDEDRVAAMSAALLSLAERAAQGLGRGDLSQVYIEGEHGTVFLVSAQDEGVLIAVTTAGAKVGMMLYEVKLAANRVGEVLRGPAPLPAPLPSHVTRGYLDAQEHAAPATAPSQQAPAYAETAYAEPAYVEPARSEPAYVEPGYSASAYTEQAYAQAAEPAQAEPVYVQPSYPQPAYAETGYAERSTAEAYGTTSQYSSQQYQEPAPAAPVVEPAVPVPAVEPSGWSSYAPTGSVLPGEQSTWS